MQNHHFRKFRQISGMVCILMSCVTTRSGQAVPIVDETIAPLIDAAAYRLSIADQVALTKWDSGKSIEDGPREQVVIDHAIRQATLRGLSAERTANFFADQIEANKLVQYELLVKWRRAGNAPDDPRPDLARDIRPKLDTLQDRLIDGLVHTSELGSRADCSVIVANAVHRYVKEKRLDVLHAIALNRAMARVCEM